MRNSRRIPPQRRVQRSRQLAPRCLAGTPRNHLGRRPLRTGCPGEGNKLILNLQTICLNNRRNLVHLLYYIAIGHLISLVFSNWISIYKYALQCNHRRQRAIVRQWLAGVLSHYEVVLINSWWHCIADKALKNMPFSELLSTESHMINVLMWMQTNETSL